MRRLAIVTGTVTGLAWLLIVMAGRGPQNWLGWLFFFIGIPISFGLGFGVIWAIDWVISGFREGRK
jgi:hypothetical protein